MLVSAWIGLAWAQEGACRASWAEIEVLLDGAEAAWGVDESAFSAAVDRLGVRLPCLADVATPAQAARVHRVEGLAAFLARDLDRWSDVTRGIDAGGVYTFAGGLAVGAHEAADAPDRFYGAHASELVGATLDAGGDLDDDGTPELIVGAPGWVGTSETVTGAVLIVWGR